MTGRGTETRVRTRALLVDDHSLFRESVARALNAESDLSVDHCASIREAVAMLAF